MAAPTATSDLEKRNAALHLETLDDDKAHDSKELPLPDPEQSIWDEVKCNPRVIAFGIIANTGSIAFGYDILLTGAVNAMPAFQRVFGEPYRGRVILPALWQGLWTAFIQMGIMFGAAISGSIQDRFGRRMSFILGGVISAIGTAFYVASPEPAGILGRRVLLLFSKSVTGLGIGMLMATCQTYVSEIAPVKLRGILLSFFPFIKTIGQLIAVTLCFTRIRILTPNAFILPFSLQWVFSGLAIIAGIILPESPISLVGREKYEAAKKAYARLHGKSSNTDEAIQKIKAILDHERLEDAAIGQATFRECFQGVNRRRSLIIIMVALLQYMLGVSILANANYFLIMAGMSNTQSLQISQIGISLQIVCITIASILGTRFGRRTIVLWSAMATGFALLAMGIAGFFQHDRTAVRFIGASILVAGSVQYLGVGAVWMVMNSEISSVRMRAKSSALSFLVNAFCGIIFSITTPYMFNADAGNLGGKIGLIFAALSFSAFGLCWMFLPETKAKSFEELDYLFEKKVPARAFAKARYGDY